MNKIFTLDETRSLGEGIGINFAEVSFDEFCMGLGVELEHGSRDLETDVTHDDGLATAKIAWAHLKEIPDYYTRLKKMEADANS